MEFESSDRKKKPPLTNVCVIYDPRDGRIVHGHIFVGDGTGLFGPQGRAERERETLEGARRNHGDISRLRALHVPPEFRFAANTKYRVDVKAGRMVEHLTFPPEKPRRKSGKRTPAKRAAKRK